MQALESADNAAASALLLGRYQATTDADSVDLDLIVRLLEFLGNHDDSSETLGAVLIFLPGKFGAREHFSTTSHRKCIPLKSSCMHVVRVLFALEHVEITQQCHLLPKDFVVVHQCVFPAQNSILLTKSALLR